MLAALVAIAVFVVLAVLILRWVQSDYASEGRLTVRSSVGLWLLYFFHADTVATAAYAGALRFDAAPATAGYVAAVLVGVPGVVLFLAVALAGRSGLVGLFGAFVTRSTRIEEEHPQRRHGAAWRRYTDSVPIVPRARRATAGRSPGPAGRR
jgi:hypothetical protein